MPFHEIWIDEPDEVAMARRSAFAKEQDIERERVMAYIRTGVWPPKVDPATYMTYEELVAGSKILPRAENSSPPAGG